MKKVIALIFMFIPAIVYCQNTHEIHFKILDSVVVKRNYPYVTLVNLEITAPNFQNNFFLYYFDVCVGSSAKSLQTKEFFHSHGLDTGFKAMTLEYVIEDDHNEIIECQSYFYTTLYPYPPENRRNESIGIFVDSEQKIIRKQLNYQERYDYGLAKHEVNSSKQNIAAPLLLSVYHKDLPKGKYWLYLTYSFKPKPQWKSKDIVNDSRTFKGEVISNKVRLIVE